MINFSGFQVDIPGWLQQEIARLPDRLSSPQERVRVANRLADRNVDEGSGGPFAALVIDVASGRPVAVGTNLVLSSGLSGAHAEVVAISTAQTILGHWDLSAAGAQHELVVNWRPCVMCYGALLWSGLRRLLIAGDGPELEELTGFDEGPMRSDWADQLQRRGIAVSQDVLRAEAVAVFERYAARDDVVVYNAGGGSGTAD